MNYHWVQIPLITDIIVIATTTRWVSEETIGIFIGT